MTSITPPYPQTANYVDFSQNLNKVLTVKNRDKFLHTYVCIYVEGRPERGYYTEPYSPANHILYIGYIIDIRPTSQSRITQIILTDLRAVAADYDTNYFTLTHDNRKQYSDYNVEKAESIKMLNIMNKKRTIDLRKFTVPKRYTINIKHNWWKPGSEFGAVPPHFYPVPPSLSPANLKIRHAQMLASLEKEYQEDYADVIAIEKTNALVALSAKLAKQKKHVHQKALKRTKMCFHSSKKRR